MLNYLDVCSSLHDIKVLETSLIMLKHITIDKDILLFLQFVFGNCDFNVNSIDGFNIFHNMAGIVIVTPCKIITNILEEIEKQSKLTQSIIVDNKGMV